MSSSPRYLLPPTAYSTASWFEREAGALFGPRWMLVASEDELAEPGAFAAATIGTAPIVAIRDEAGTLRAFQNVCRHRGMRLLDATGCVGSTIECFYHQWRYGLDGSLAVVPQRRDQFPDLDPQAWGLLPASVAEWEGMVFVHPDPDARPLSTALGAVPEHLGTFRPGLLRQVVHER
ncbi:MAG: aromatic ring-hydroxylating oxygenase subunit alpha, partial [Acidimicrobiales bacterium]